MRLLLLLLSAVAAFAQSGGFQAATRISAEAGASFVVEDFNLDGRPDIAVAGRWYTGLSIYLQTENGGFISAPPFAINLGAASTDIASGDLNNDGRPDLIVAVESTSVPVMVWLGSGSGEFVRQGNWSGSGRPFKKIRLADFDRDGNLDVLAVSAVAVQLLRGMGNGSLAAGAQTILTANHADYDFFGGMDAGDFDGDGDVDFVAQRLGFTVVPQVHVGRNDGQGVFSTGTNIGLTPHPCCWWREAEIRFADVTGDGALEVLVERGEWTAGTGVLSASSTLPPDHGTRFSAADFNFDGKADWLSGTVQNIKISLSTGQGVESAAGSPYPFSMGWGVPIAADMDGDYRPEVIIGDGDSLLILHNRLPYTPYLSLQIIQFDPITTLEAASAPLKLVATATSGLPVIFSSSTATICDVVSKTFVRFLRPGTCTIMARQAGNKRFAAAEPVVRRFTVSFTIQTIHFEQLSDRAVNSAPFSIAATASSGLPVSIAAGPAGVCKAAGNVITLVAVGQCSVTASQAGNTVFSAATPVTQVFAVTGGPRVTSVSNAASYSVGRLAPSSYGVLFGTSLTDAVVTLRDASGVMHALQLIFAGATQINFIVPADVASGPAALIVATVSGSAEFPVTIAATAPGLFSANGTGQGLAAAQALIVNNDKSVTTLTVADGLIPVRSGTDIYLVLYGTGIRGHGSEVLATLAGRPVEVLYAGPQGAFPGLDQVNLKVPLSVASAGNVEIRLTVDGTAANAVTANFQ
jgi:uncharacterized protein (TIGR03437 family)